MWYCYNSSSNIHEDGGNNRLLESSNLKKVIGILVLKDIPTKAL